MKVLLVGANGATGKCLVSELLNRNDQVVIIVRSTEKLPPDMITNQNLTIIKASILELSEDLLVKYSADCDAVASCLGHNLSFKGIFGKPKMLVTDAVIKLCTAIEKNRHPRPVKFVLMNTTGNRNKNADEKQSLMEKVVFFLVRNFIPPQRDNEHAAEYLRQTIGNKSKVIEWVIVRPDTLLHEETVSPYDVFPSPVRSPVFDAGKTSRINVGHFMADLITKDAVWNTWKWQMPVIYNRANSKGD